MVKIQTTKQGGYLDFFMFKSKKVMLWKCHINDWCYGKVDSQSDLTLYQTTKFYTGPN